MFHHKFLITAFFFLISGTIFSQKINSENIIGVWRFHKEVDNRKGLSCIPIKGYQTENGTGYPDRTYYNDGTFKDYYTKDDIRYGQWEIENYKLLITYIYSQEFIDTQENLMPFLIANNMILKVDKGNFYIKLRDQHIRKMRKGKMELGSQELYLIYKRI